MSTSNTTVFIGSTNNGVSTLLTEGAAKTLGAIYELVREGVLDWSDVWQMFSVDGAQGIATFSHLGHSGVTGTQDDLDQIIADITAAGGHIHRFAHGNPVPRSNQRKDEPDSVTLNSFRHTIGLDPVDTMGEERELVGAGTVVRGRFGG